MAPHSSARRGTKLNQATAKLKRARGNVDRFTQKEQDIDNELQQLKQRMYWLKTLRKLNRGQYNDWLTSVNDRSIIPFCKAWNLHLGEEMQARLPVEMRNLVYHYLWDAETLEAYPDLVRVAGGAKCLDNPCRCEWTHNSPVLPHFVKIEYMGRPAAQEIVRALYEAFHYRKMPLTVRMPQHIKSALSQDTFQVGIDPGLYLRSLMIRIKLDRLRKPNLLHCESVDDYQHTPAERIYTEREQLQSWLKALLYVKCKANFQLEIELLQRNIRLSIIEETLLALADVRKTMEDRHAAVTVFWHYRGDWSRGENKDGSVDLLCRNVGDFYCLPRRLWRATMGLFLIEADEDGMIRQKHARFYNEPCEHVSDHVFVHAMWQDSEDEFTTDGEEEDQEHEESSDEDDGESDDADDNDEDGDDRA